MTDVSDAGIKELAALEKLTTLELWRTGIRTKG